MTLDTIMAQLKSYGRATLYCESKTDRWCVKVDLPRHEGIDVKLAVHADDSIVAAGECERLASEIVRERAGEEDGE